MQQIAVVDYGMGNLRSVSKALEHVAPGAEVTVTDDAGAIRAADRVVVPGQGAARDCMRALVEHDLIGALDDALRERPFLGICMGLQVLLSRSEEDQGVDCLDWFDGDVQAFHARIPASLKIPHMGWNRVRQQQRHPLFEGIDDDARFYFVHSYYTRPSDTALVAATSHHGVEFACALARDNVFACQFHPEKSAADGLRLLQNFVRWDGTC